jgi:hypothetical protein
VWLGSSLTPRTLLPVLQYRLDRFGKQSWAGYSTLAPPDGDSGGEGDRQGDEEGEAVDKEWGSLVQGGAPDYTLHDQT